MRLRRLIAWLVFGLALGTAPVLADGTRLAAVGKDWTPAVTSGALLLVAMVLCGAAGGELLLADFSGHAKTAAFIVSAGCWGGTTWSLFLWTLTVMRQDEASGMSPFSVRRAELEVPLLSFDQSVLAFLVAVAICACATITGTFFKSGKGDE